MVATLTVNGEGAVTSGWVAEGGDYTRLQSDDGDTSRLYTPTVNDVRLVTLTDTSDLDGATINSVKVYAKVRSLDPVSNTVQVGVYTHSNQYWSADKDTNPSTDYILFSETWTVNPATGDPWTPEELDDLQIGLKKTNGVGMGWTYAYVEVDYTDGGGGETTLTADGGTYTVTGTAASLEYGRGLSAGSGAYSVTGTVAGVVYDRNLAADSGAFTVSGTAANLEKATVISVDSGSFVVTGTAATVLHDRLLDVQGGAYTITGTDATLDYDQAITLSAGPGSFGISGATSSLIRDGLLSAASGSLVVTGSVATLTYEQGRTLAAEAGVFAITVAAATLTHNVPNPSPSSYGLYNSRPLAVSEDDLWKRFYG